MPQLRLKSWEIDSLTSFDASRGTSSVKAKIPHSRPSSICVA